jgi:lipid-binding SYLF domain-containing protein
MSHLLVLGVFAGCSIEGNIVMTRASANVQFYGDPSINASEILLGSMKQPKAAAPLYATLSDLLQMSNVR